MRRGPQSDARLVVIVLGCDEVGSAVAHQLHRDGFAAVLIDGIDPPWVRRGMAFTDAWYAGTAELSGVSAVFCASVRSIPAVLDRTGAVAATTWSWAGVASALSPVAMVDTRAPSARRSSIDRASAPPLIAIEVVPGAITGPEFDIAIRTPPSTGVRERVLYAEQAGRFSTTRSIGERVRPGDVIGSIGDAIIVAPIDGCLRGLAARGARMHASSEVAEVDPRADPLRCFGLHEHAAAIARGVSEALACERPAGRIATRSGSITAST